MVRRLCRTIRAGFIPTVPPYFARRSFSEGGLHLCFFGLLTNSVLRQAQDDIGYPMVTEDAGFPLSQESSTFQLPGTAKAQPLAFPQGTPADIVIFNTQPV